MKSIAICITNDLKYDRRVQRSVGALSEVYNVKVLHRKLYADSKSGIQTFFARGFLFYAEFNIRLFFKLLRIDTDTITSIDYDTLPACYLAARIRRSKLVFDAHELFEHSIEIVDRPLVRSFWAWIGRIFVPRVDKAYTVSSSIATFYSERFGVNFELIRNLPYACGKTLEHKPKQKKVILYQGVINQGRMLEVLVTAIDLLPKEYEVWIIGEGDLSEKIRQISGERVIFHSWVEPVNLVRYTQQAFLAYNLLASNSKSYIYSLANKFFDYIQSGIPSLNNVFPEYQLMNERYNCCYTRDVTGPEELASWILEISRDRDKWEEKRKNSLLAARELTWEKESKKLIKIYDFDSNTHF